MLIIKVTLLLSFQILLFTITYYLIYKTLEYLDNRKNAKR
jgi:hypothetical protein